MIGRGAPPETVAERWRRLSPHIVAIGPADAEPRPAVLLFHGCGGMRDYLRNYAEMAAAAGVRAFIIDSFAPRGWSRAKALGLVCTGLRFRGAERAGDVLAAVWGVKARADVDADRVALAGWSHGSWSIMDLMTMPMQSPGEAGLADATPAHMAGVEAVFLVYPYGGVGALSRVRDWVRTPRTMAVICEQDHITSLADAERVFARVANAGAPMELWRAAATHGFDEPGRRGPMRHDPELTAEAHDRFRRFLEEALLAQPGGAGRETG